MVVKEEISIRKGPWTEQEDLQLVCFVGLFGDRRWDFIAKVSGLKRTGKSCRLRWVNYLHPSLKRGKMTPHEEKLVLELHSQWGNRWSKIARRLPGRTDNEIKNYWRTHMRKKAQERKQPTTISPPSSSSSLSNCSSSISLNNETSNTEATTDDITAGSSCSTHQGARIPADLPGKKNPRQEGDDEQVYTLDDIWKDITSSESQTIKPVYSSETATTFNCPPLAASPLWEYNTGMMMWSSLDDEVLCRNMYNDPFLSSYGAP